MKRDRWFEEWLENEVKYDPACPDWVRIMKARHDEIEDPGYEPGPFDR